MILSVRELSSKREEPVVHGVMKRNRTQTSEERKRYRSRISEV
jgi:hypothetical protein